MQQFRDVKVWNKAHQVGLLVYRITAQFPKSELYGLTSQIRRAAVSIPSNIAEGCGRNSTPELARFLEIAKGSASELDYQLFLSKELGYLNSETHTDLTEKLVEVQKMLAGFIKTVRARSA